MSSARFIVDRMPAAGERLRLSPAESAHARARRLSRGEAVVLIDGSGAEASGEIVADGPSGYEVMVAAVHPAGDPGPRVCLAVAAVRRERLDWIAEKAGELGVERLVLVRSGRTQAFRSGLSAVERLDRLAREAAKQSGSARWPRCEGPIDFMQCLAQFEGAERVIVALGGEPFPRRMTGAGAVALLVGPEGGWTADEISAAVSSGWRPASLPAATLRTETACIAAVVLARAAMSRA